MVRIFPFNAISALPANAASTVMYRTSDTRIPVPQMVSISSANRALPLSLAAAIHIHRGRRPFLLHMPGKCPDLLFCNGMHKNAPRFV